MGRAVVSVLWWGGDRIWHVLEISIHFVSRQYCDYRQHPGYDISPSEGGWSAEGAGGMGWRVVGKMFATV